MKETGEGGKKTKKKILQFICGMVYSDGDEAELGLGVNMALLGGHGHV